MKDLKELYSSPCPHSLEYVKDTFATKFETLKNELLQSIKEETNTLKVKFQKVNIKSSIRLGKKSTDNKEKLVLVTLTYDDEKFLKS